MLTEQLTKQDLVETLEPESIFDYLIQHGVLDEGTRDGICEEGSKVSRNMALLEHLQEAGDSGIQLFINALRQSGQMKLASSLDVKGRIKPTYGSGYLGKERYKGQVTIKILVDSILAFFPKWEEGDQLEEKHGDTPEKEVKGRGGTSLNDLHLVLTPRRMHKSYENMTMIEDPSTMSPRSWKIRQYAFDHDLELAQEDDDEGFEKSRGFCWCLCIPRRKKNKSKKVSKASASKRSQPLALDLPHSGSESPVVRLKPLVQAEVQSSNTYSPKRGDGNNPDLINDIMKAGNVQSSAGKIKTNSSKSSEKGKSVQNQHNSQVLNVNKVKGKQTEKSSQSTKNSGGGKENKPPPNNSVTKAPEKYPTPIKQTISHRDSTYSEKEEPVEFCTMWKSRGPTFDKFVNTFYQILDKNNVVKSEIVKHFEQDRGTLVLSMCQEEVWQICNICMTKTQVKKVQSDERSGVLTELVENMVLNKQLYDEIGVDELKLHVVVDDAEVELALDDLN